MKRTAVVGCITCSLVAMSWPAEAAGHLERQGGFCASGGFSSGTAE